MDKSQVYILMCQKAEEIQSLRREERHLDSGKWQEGDFWVWGDSSNDVAVVHHCNDAWMDEPEYLHHPTECTWLPRQDQLQIISGLSWKEFDVECQKYDMDTKEQAGICVVMREVSVEGHKKRVEIVSTHSLPLPRCANASPCSKTRRGIHD